VNELEQNEFEGELRRIKPAAAPEDLLRRLADARPDNRRRAGREERRPAILSPWWLIVRWAGAVALVVVVASLMWRSGGTKPRPEAAKLIPIASHDLKADGVEVDQSLVSSFDAVAQLPGGEPVRLRVRNWMDNVVLRDTDRGLVIGHSNPRVEVVPVGFEVY
jgi:hypothetical protein